MKQLFRLLVAGSVCLVAALAQKPNPFLGRWDFNLGPNRASWLGITEKNGGLDIWFQPTGGNVYQVKEYKLAGSHLTLNLGGNFSWDLQAAGDKLTGQQKRVAERDGVWRQRRQNTMHEAED